jgi:hypothetical protein
LLLDVRAETRRASGRRWIVADSPGPPADAFDIELTQFLKTRYGCVERWLAPIRLSVDVEPSCSNSCLPSWMTTPTTTSRAILKLDFG